MHEWPSRPQWWSFLGVALTRLTLSAVAILSVAVQSVKPPKRPVSTWSKGTSIRGRYWITPEIEPRRYDTRFFVAKLPADQEASDISGETDHAEWSTPDEALAAEHTGQIRMLPPTMSILIELADLPTVAEVINNAAGRQVEPVLPILVKAGSDWEFRYPQVNPRETPT
jgi:hypothetical protein